MWVQVGIIGATGSGKTTLVDIILGLLEPQSGQLIIDGNELTSKYKIWQIHWLCATTCYLSDDTFIKYSFLESRKM